MEYRIGQTIKTPKGIGKITSFTWEDAQTQLVMQTEQGLTFTISKNNARLVKDNPQGLTLSKWKQLNKIHESKQVKALIKLLERYTGKKVELQEAVVADLKTPERVAAYIKSRFRVHGVGAGLAARVNNSHVVVNDKLGNNNATVKAQVFKDLQGNGFKLYARTKKLHDKLYTVLKNELNIYVLIEK